MFEHTQEPLFQFLSYSPGIFWIMILFFPATKRAMLFVDGYIFFLALLFVLQTLPVLDEIFKIIFSPTYLEMKDFLGSHAGFLGSWNHMILSDIWIGRWVAQDSLKFEKSLLIRIIIIPVILVVGPFGLFFYLAFRMIRTKSFGFNDAVKEQRQA